MLWFKFFHFECLPILKNYLLLFIDFVCRSNIMLNFSFFKILFSFLLLSFQFLFLDNLFKKFLILFLLSGHFDFIDFESSSFTNDSFWFKINCRNFCILTITHQNFSRRLYLNLSVFVNCNFKSILLSFLLLKSFKLCLSSFFFNSFLFKSYSLFFKSNFLLLFFNVMLQ